MIQVQLICHIMSMNVCKIDDHSIAYRHVIFKFQFLGPNFSYIIIHNFVI